QWRRIGARQQFLQLAFKALDPSPCLDQRPLYGVIMGRVAKPRRIKSAVLGKPIPGFENEPLSAVLTELSFLPVPESLKRLNATVRPKDIFRVEYVEQFVAAEVVYFAGNEGIDLCHELRALHEVFCGLDLDWEVSGISSCVPKVGHLRTNG